MVSVHIALRKKLPPYTRYICLTFDTHVLPVDIHKLNNQTKKPHIIECVLVIKNVKDTHTEKHKHRFRNLN